MNFVVFVRNYALWKFNTLFSNKLAFVLRLLVGLGFGLALAWLIETSPENRIADSGSETWRQVSIAVVSLLAFVLWAGIGAMRRISLAIWTVACAVLIAFITHHNVTMGNSHDIGYWGEAITFLIFPFLFIVHELASSGDQADRIIAPYETYFDEAWKRGVQLILSIVFTFLFSGILNLGAALLNFIGIDWLKELLDQKYFIAPTMAMAMASAVHLGDVQPKLLSNFRNLILSIFSWLLPLIVLVGAIFVISLAFTGLAPLWGTKAATATLLAGCVLLVLLINAAYGQGEKALKINVILKVTIRVATVILAIFAFLSAYSLGLRINQYGLTPDRVFAGIGVAISVCFGISYLLANFGRGGFMVNIERANIGMAFVKAAVFFAVLTPIANPSKLSVNSQTGRLLANKITPEKFDWHALRFETGKYGTMALVRLARSSNSQIREMAIRTQAIKDEDRYAAEPPEAEVQLRKPQVSQLTIVTNGTALPVSFLNYGFNVNDTSLPICLRETFKSAHCEAAIVDLNRDNKPEIVLKADYQVFVLQEKNAAWASQNINGFALDANFKRAFDSGEIFAKAPEWDDLVVGNQTIDIPTN